MKVYRFMTRDEFEKWTSGNTTGIGSNYKESETANTHKYNPNTRYIHFFRDLFVAPSILSIFGLEIDHLCQFDIDEKILAQFEGKGTYAYNGEDIYGNITAVEYAIPAKLVDNKSLIGYKIINTDDDVKYLNEKIGWSNPIESECEPIA